jgi:DNA-directed RNA polymerase I and III subunit RPAC1
VEESDNVCGSETPPKGSISPLTCLFPSKLREKKTYNQVVLTMLFQEYRETGPALLGNDTFKLRGRFRVAPTNHILVNALRREILVGVPTVGFRTEPAELSEVVIHTNTTPLVNEMIAHRIGMIPIKADPSEFDPERYEFHLDVENTGKSIIDVTASDFVIIEKDPDNPLDEGKRIPTEQFFPPDPITGETCLITRLRPQWNMVSASTSNSHERLSLKAKACISTGKENIRWSPVSQCSFENTLDESPERQTEMFHKWLEISKKIPDPTVVGSERIAELRREYDTMEKHRCFIVDEETGEPNDFTFYIESVGVLPVPEIVRLGIDSLIRKISKYQDLDGELPEGVQIRHANTQFPCVEFVFHNESHTLGGLLQYYIDELHNTYTGTEEPKISYVGYDPGHPLRNEMFLKVGVGRDIDDPELEFQTARLVVAKTCRYLKTLFKSMMEDWATLFTTQQEQLPQ